MPPVISTFFDVDDDESGDRQLRDSPDEVTATFAATAMPVELGFTDAQAFHSRANLGDINVLAEDGSKQVGAGIQVGA